MTKRYLPFLAALGMAGLPSPVQAQPVGPEFQANTYTTGFQGDSAVASDASGNFVVVWISNNQDGSGYGTFGQRYDRAGNPLGGEFQVNTYTRSNQWGTSVASAASGNFVVVWSSGYDQDGNGYGTFGQRYDNNGNRLGGEFQVNTYTTSRVLFSTFPSVASDTSGNFVVVWTSDFQDGSDVGVFGQRYDSGGNRLGGEFPVNTYTTNNQLYPALASDANGNFVVVWASDFQDGSYYGVFGQRYDSGGNRLGGEFQVNTYTTGRQGGFEQGPAVASDARGNFVVVWTRDSEEVFGQRYDSNGNALGGEFQVNTYTSGAQGEPAVASDENGNFVVTWAGAGPTDNDGIFGQRYDGNGNALGGEFQVNTYTRGRVSDPSVAADASGNFVVVWNSLQDGSSYGTFGQRFSAGCNVSVRVQGDVNTAGTIVPVQVHIAHHRPKTVTVRWTLSLLDADGQVIAKHMSPPHTFEPGDVLDQEVKFQLPDDLASGEYTLDLAVKRMAGTKGARTTLRVIRSE